MPSQIFAFFIIDHNHTVFDLRYTANDLRNALSCERQRQSQIVYRNSARVLAAAGEDSLADRLLCRDVTLGTPLVSIRFKSEPESRNKDPNAKSILLSENQSARL
jgi:hypothetical protein